MGRAAPVQVRFVSTGHKEVLAAFESVTARMKKLHQTQLANERGAARSSVGAMTRDAKIQEKSRVAASKAIAAAEASATRTTEREAKRRADAEIRETKRAEREKIRAANAVARAEARAATQAQKETRSRVRSIAAPIKSGIRNAAGTITGVGITAGGALGTYAVGAGIMDAIAAERTAAQIANSATMPGFAPTSAESLMSQAQATSKQHGVKTEDVLGLMGTVSARAGGAKGLEAVRKDLDDITRTAVAAGVSMEDMGALYAGAMNAGVEPGKEIQQLMRDYVAQGKAGAVEIADLAAEAAKLGGAGRKFGGGASMLRRVTGLAQIAVESAVSPEESRTVVVDMLREMSQAEKITALGKGGVKVSGANGKLRDPAELLADTIHSIESGNKLGKYGGKTSDAKLGAYGYVFTGASNQLAMNLRDTYMKAGGGEAGRQAVLARVNTASKPFEMTAEQRDKEYANIEKTNAFQIDKAIADFKVEIAKLLPEITKILPELTKLTQGFAKIAVWAGQNPFKAVMAVFAASIAKEVALAKLGSVLERAVKSLLGGGAGGGAGVGVGGGVGKLGQATAVLSAGLLGYAAGEAIAPYVFNPLDDAGKNEAARANTDYWNMKNMASGLRGKKLTEKDKANLQAWSAYATKRAGEVAESASPSGINAINPNAQWQAQSFRTSQGVATQDAFNEVAAQLAELAKSAGEATKQLANVKAPDGNTDPKRVAPIATR